MPPPRALRAPHRPRLDERDESVQVCLSLPARQYDDLYKAASTARVSVPEVIRRRLRGTSDHDDD